MPAAKKNGQITFNLLSMDQSQNKVTEIMDLLLRMNSIHFNIPPPVSARDQLNSTNYPENISTVKLVPSNSKTKKVSYVTAERPALYGMMLPSKLFARI